jgi:hypothetical protein
LSDINLDEYYSAGYFLIRKNKRPDWLGEPAGLVPDELISLESEFCPKFHLSWGWGSNDRTEALQFGIDEAKWDEFEKWCTHFNSYEMEVWSMFHSTDAVRRFMKTFIPESKCAGLTIVGVGLHQSCEADWKEPDGTEGVELRILEHLPLEQGGHILGFEVAGYGYHNFDHSWFSHNHHKGVFEELGIRPGNFGLLPNPDEATRVRDYANEHDQYEHYEYWLLAAYPLTADEIG